MNGSHSTNKNSSKVSVNPMRLFLNHLFNWKTIKACLFTLIIVDSLYDLFVMAMLCNQISRTGPFSRAITKTLILILVLLTFRVLNFQLPKTSSKKHYWIGPIEVTCLTLSYFLNVWFDNKIQNIDDFHRSLPHELKESILSQLALETCSKLIIFEFCSANSMLKVVYMTISMCTFLLISQVDVYNLLNFGFLSNILLMLCVIYVVQRVRTGVCPLQQRVKVSKRIINFMPEGVLIFCSKEGLTFANSYMQNILSSGSAQGKSFSVEDLNNMYISEPAIQRIKGKNPISSAPPKQLDQCTVICPLKEKLINKICSVDTLNSVLALLRKEPEIWNCLKKYILTLQVRYIRQTSPQEVLNLEVSINVFQIDTSGEALIILFRDTSERQKIISLEKENDIYRNNLIATFSHELRTPLNGNLAFIQQAIDNSDVPCHVKSNLLLPALISGKFLLSIVDDILDYSQIILNKLHLKLRSGSLVHVAEQCVELFREKLRQKNLQVKLTVALDVPSMTTTDHKRVSQILINLLSNAAKFTKEGMIEIKLALTSEHNVLISVVDTGPGMNETTQENLRKNMINGHIKEKVDSNSAGIGFGLYISNALACLMNPIKKAGVQFVSKKGEGSEFYFEIETRRFIRRPFETLNRVRSNDMEERQHHEKISVKSYSFSSHSLHELDNQGESEFNANSSPQVLIVDDEAFNIMIIENFCKKLGIQTARAFDGQEALEKIKDSTVNGVSSFKLILMDVNMPVMDGYQATTAIKALEKSKEIEEATVVGITAYIAQEMIDKCYESGMDEVLHKPVSKEMIVDVLTRYKILG